MFYNCSVTQFPFGTLCMVDLIVAENSDAVRIIVGKEAGTLENKFCYYWNEKLLKKSSFLCCP